jgi:UDP-N-acetylmuramoylalanine--D-glutamate ligase
MRNQAPIDIGRWRRALVYGLGASGRAATALLRGRGVEVVAVDRGPDPPDPLGTLASDPGVELRLGAEPETLPPGIDGVVLSPGVAPEKPLVASARRFGVPVVAEVELAFHFLSGPVLGITGSNGKSTTTALTGALLEAAGFSVEVCGNIGRPLSEVVQGPPRRVFVVELSSFQLQTIHRFRPVAAALLNLSPDHLDRHPSLDAYRDAKARIFENQGAQDTAVLNADDPALAGLEVPSRRRTFSLAGPVADGCWLEGETVMESAPGVAPRRLFCRDDLMLPGDHNLENAMAAALLALALGAPVEALARGLRRFKGLPHRTQLVGVVGGVRFVDDSKGTNPGASARALAGFEDGSVHVILGGRGKEASFEELAEVVERKARQAYLIGEAAEELARVLEGRVGWRMCHTLERAVSEAAAAARPGEVVLLSPACASFDQFRSFVHRGEHFQQLVQDLARRSAGGHGPGAAPIHAQSTAVKGVP